MNTTARTRTEVLGRYSTPAGARILYARRKGEVIYVTDEPATPTRQGVYYRVEQLPIREGDTALEALVVDYLEQAHTTGSVPMASTLLNIELETAA